MRRNVSIFVLILVVAAGLVLIGCNAGQPSTDDAATIAAIQSQLYQNPDLKPLNVHVSSDHGIVTLTGQVQSTLDKLAIEDLAQKVPGVKQVADQLAITTDAAAQAPSPVASTKSPVRHEASEHKPRRHRSAQQAQNDSDMAMNGQTQPTHDQAATPESSYAGSSPNPPVQPAAAPAAPPPPPQPVAITIPSGTVVSIRMIDSITSQTAQAGQEFAATVFAPVAVGDHIVVPQGADAKVRLVQVHSAGHYQGQSELKVELTSLSFNGNSYNVESGYYDKTGSSRGKNSAEKIGGGAGLGALIGGLIGHGAGAAIGAGVGAAGGTVAQGASHGQQVTIPSEAKIDFVLKSPLTVTQSPQSPAQSATGGNGSGQ